MFRVGAFISIALVLSLIFGCSDKTSDTQPTGLELAFGDCISFIAYVTIDGDTNAIRGYSSERAWFVDVPAGNHVLEAYANLVVVQGDSSFCWAENFSVSEGNVTRVTLLCDTAGCAGR